MYYILGVIMDDDIKFVRIDVPLHTSTINKIDTWAKNLGLTKIELLKVLFTVCLENDKYSEFYNFLIGK